MADVPRAPEGVPGAGGSSSVPAAAAIRTDAAAAIRTDEETSPAVTLRDAGDRTTRIVFGAVLLTAAGVVAGVAAALPWNRLSTGEETRTFTGLTVGDGRITLAAAIIMIVIGLARLLGRRTGAADATVAIVLAAGVVVVAGMDFVAGPPTLSSFRGLSADRISVVPESGLILTLAAGLVALAGGLLLRRRRPTVH